MSDPEVPEGFELVTLKPGRFGDIGGLLMCQTCGAAVVQDFENTGATLHRAWHEMTGVFVREEHA